MENFIKNYMEIKKIFFLLTFVINIYSNDLKIIDLKKLLQVHSEIEYIKCHDSKYFNYNKFPLSKFKELQPNEGVFAQTFILKIPNGQVFSGHGFVKVDDYIIEDCLAPYLSLGHLLDIMKHRLPNEEPVRISGKVAVITRLWDDCYAHWIFNVLSRLALLELYNIKYDYLYVASDKQFMKETLSLWGIPNNKILSPFNKKFEYIQADELIVPSHIGKIDSMPNQYPLNWVPIKEYCKLWKLDPNIIKLPFEFDYPSINTNLPENVSVKDYFLREQLLCGIYFVPWATEYIRNKFLPFVENKNYKFCKKIFISRSDASIRKMLNEDDVFAVFEKIGFARYVLSKMSALEQIALFNGADIIVGAHGSSMANIMFCKTNTKIIEIFQGRSDCAFYYLSQILHLNYYPVQTKELDNIGGLEHTSVSLDIIQNIIDTIL